MEMIIESPSGLGTAVERLLSTAAGRRVFTFQGEVGAGKTTFIQALCRYWQVEAAVTSPTFALVNEYSGRDPASGKKLRILHLDLYRLRELQEALDIGIEEILDSEAYCLIEWPELIESLLPADTLRIKMEIVEDSVRKILFL